MQHRFALPLRALVLAFVVAGAAACGKDSPTGPSGPTGPQTRLGITNSTSVSVFYVMVRSCGATNWGNDLLGANIISAGTSKSFTVAPGCHDIRLETSPTNNSEHEWLNVDFAAGQTTTRTVTSWTPSQ